MLVLTRRIGEVLMIGDDVNVTVLGVKGNQIRLGINAPESIPVHREEIYLKNRLREVEVLRSEWGNTPQKISCIAGSNQ